MTRSRATQKMCETFLTLPNIRVLDEYYSKASDENKKKAVEVLDRLMGEEDKK